MCGMGRGGREGWRKKNPQDTFCRGGVERGGGIHNLNSLWVWRVPVGKSVFMCLDD